MLICSHFVRICQSAVGMQSGTDAAVNSDVVLSVCLGGSVEVQILSYVIPCI